MKKAVRICIPAFIAAIFLCSCGGPKSVLSNTDTSQASTAGTTASNGSSDESSSLKLNGSKTSTITNYSTTIISTYGTGSSSTTTMKVWQSGNKIRYESDGCDFYIDGDTGDYVTVDLSTNTGTKMKGDASSAATLMNPFILADTLSATLSYYAKTSSTTLDGNDCTVYEYKGSDSKVADRLYVSKTYNVILKWEELSNNAVTSSYEFSKFTVGKVTDKDVTVPSTVTITDLSSLLSDLS